MVDLVDIMSNFGKLPLQAIWIPVLIWTVVAAPLYVILRKRNLKLAAQGRFVLSTLLLFALPAGLLMAPFVEPVRIQIPHSSTVTNGVSLSVSPEMVGS
ncbi:MAG: hypothetical protein E2O84_02960 [Bacteroidetes bacterium]|nr:MAG: hypothetical protein E2O84_02960 [Bacteroidota bacterium]